MAAKRVGLSSITAPKDLLNSIPGDDADVDPFAATRRPTVDSRQSEYHARRQRIISPERLDPFAALDKTPDESVRTYADVLRENELEREKQAVLRTIMQKRKEAEEKAREEGTGPPVDATPIADGSRKKRRWDVTPAAADIEASKGGAAVSEWDLPDSAPSTATGGHSRCGPARPPTLRLNKPGCLIHHHPMRFVGACALPRDGRWDETPTRPDEGGGAARKKNRWDETPVASAGETPARSDGGWGETPASASETPSGT